MIRLVFEGEPISKKRHRCRCINGHGAIFDPQVREEMEPMKKRILEEWNKLFDDPNSSNHQEATLLAHGDHFHIILNFFLPLNKSDAVWQKNLKIWGIQKCNEKPDFDNLAKFYTDCATGIIWPDDKMISCATVHKVRYSENPRTELTIMTNKELTLDERQISVFKAFSPEQMKQFILQAKELSLFMECNEEYFGDTVEVPGKSFLSEASMLLIKFADSFSDKLKKIAKA